MCRCYQAYVLHKGAIARKSTVLTRRFNLIQLFFLKLSSRRMCQAYREEQPNLKASWEKVPDPTKENAFSCVDLCIHYFSYWKILHQRVCDMNWSLSCMKSEKIEPFCSKVQQPFVFEAEKDPSSGTWGRVSMVVYGQIHLKVWYAVCRAWGRRRTDMGCKGWSTTCDMRKYRDNVYIYAEAGSQSNCQLMGSGCPIKQTDMTFRLL